MGEQEDKAVTLAVIAELMGEVEDLKTEIRSLQTNPPMGAQAMVGDLDVLGLQFILETLRLESTKVLENPSLLHTAHVEVINAEIQRNGGILATLLTPATGGSRPPLLNIEDVMDVLSISAPASDEFALRLALGQLAGAAQFRIDPVHPNPPASKQAQIISSKLLQRPQLAEEVFRLLMVDFA